MQNTIVRAIHVTSLCVVCEACPCVLPNVCFNVLRDVLLCLVLCGMYAQVVFQVRLSCVGLFTCVVCKEDVLVCKKKTTLCVILDSFTSLCHSKNRAGDQNSRMLSDRADVWQRMAKRGKKISRWRACCTSKCVWWNVEECSTSFEVLGLSLFGVLGLGVFFPWSKWRVNNEVLGNCATKY